MKDTYWLKVRINGHDIEAGVSEAFMRSPMLSDIISQAFYISGMLRNYTYRWNEWEVFDLAGNRLEDSRLHLRSDLIAGSTVVVNKPVGFGA